MNILNYRPAPPGGNALARFDVQLDGMRFYNLTLKKTGAGLRVFAPSAYGSATITFTPEVSAALVALVTGEIDHNECSAA